MKDIEVPKNAEINSIKGAFATTAKKVSESDKASKWGTSKHIHFFPLKETEWKSLESIAKNHIFKGAGPSKPIFGSEDRLITMGSCFANRLKIYLEHYNKSVNNIYVPEGLNNSFAIRQYIEWCMTGDTSSDAYWYDKSNVTWTSDVEQKKVLDEYKKAAGVVITLGLSEVWRDKKTKGVFWRGVPFDKFNASRHETIVSTVEENLSNIEKIIYSIKENAGVDKKIIFTLSPVPLNATNLDRSCIISDCVSKSILRVSLELMQQKKIKNVYYWPSFEMVKWTGSHMENTATFGGGGGNSRHVTNTVSKIIIEEFIRQFFKELV